MTDFPKLHRIKSDDENMEKIHVAARKGLTDEVRRLIDTGVNPTIQNRFGCTALHLACKFGCVDTAKYLASVGEVQSMWHGQKPIHLAVMANKMDLVVALVEGAKQRGQTPESVLNECDEREVSEIGGHVKECKGQTALHWCVGLGADYLPMIKLLVQLGASPTAKDKAEETPLMRAMEFHSREALETMLDNVPSKGALRLDYADRQGNSHLHWAILNNYEDVALRFVEDGVDVNVEDSEHVVPVYLSVRAAMVTLTKELVEKSDVFLIQTCPYHNGTTVQPDRITWLDFVPADADAARQEVMRLLQDKLDEVTRSLNGGADSAVKKKKRTASTVKRMNLAPSAPVRTRSRSRTRSTVNK
ncbi:Ankyrin repeats (3 copies)/Ankyrin repeats (many copies)/Ankyrin repeat [Novymonas esmeraldas]|uniref:Ankyrin repeats (3 copies)/Ankyrin repeats (Many copies)/Ankyrin repeat n=1 Tax=Novymonas esmeraldas TaxID=1808958 RepID=A0AAW0F0B7_9TRYP